MSDITVVHPMRSDAAARRAERRAAPMRRRVRRFVGSFAVLAVLGGIGVAFAFWTGTHSRTAGIGVADSVSTGQRPTVAPSGSTATVSWAASTLQSGAAVDGYIVKRYDTNDVEQTVSPSCAGTVTTLSCIEMNVPDGTWKYTVTPVIGLWQGAESPARVATVGAAKLALTPATASTVAGASTQILTVERQDVNGAGTTVGARVVTLASDSPSGAFRNAADTAIITSLTIPDGQSSATFRYRDTVAGGASITASSAGLTGATQTITVTAASASKLSFTTSPASATAGVSLAPQAAVTVQDAFGNIVTGSTVSVTLAIKSGTGTAGAVLSGCAQNPRAAVNGIAQFASCSIDKSGTGYRLTATATGLAAADSAPFDLSPGAAASLVLVQQPTSAVAGVAIAPAVTVRIEDANGNLTTSTASVTIGFAAGFNTGGGTLSGTTTVAATNGVATFTNLSIDKAAAGYKLTATSPSLSTATSAAFTITAAQANRVSFAAQPSPTTAGAAITPAVTVRVEDAFGNLVTTSAATVNVALTAPGAATLSGTTSIAASGGIASFSTLTVNKTGTYSLTATSSGLAPSTSATFVISAGSATTLVFAQQPISAVAGAAIAPAVTVRIEDANGNLTSSNANVTVAIGTNGGSPVAGTLSGTKTVAAVGGVATFADLSIDKVGTGYTLTAASGTLAGTTSTSFSISVAAASRLTYGAQPSNAVAGVTIAPAVTVRIEDAFGNLITTSAANVTVALTTPGAATLSGTTTVAASSGVATFANLSANRTGTYTLTATSPGLTSATSSTFSIQHAALASVTFSTQPSGSTGGVAFTTQPVVALKDAFTNPITTPTTVVLAVTGNPAVGFSCTSTTVTSDSNGLATFAGCKINTAGTYTLTATSSSVTATSTAITIATGPAAAVTFTTQPSATTIAGVAFAQQPAVTVKDLGGNPVNGDSVVLSVTGNPSVGFTCTATTVTTNAAGLASFAGCKINTAAAYTLTATDGALSSASGTVTITAGPVATLTFSTQPSATTVAGVALATQPAVTVKDAFGNVIVGDSVTLTVTGNPVVGFSCTNATVTSGASGVATFAGCKLTKTGTYTLTATDGAVTATSTSVAITPAAAAIATFTTQPSASAIANVVLAQQPAVTVVDAFGNVRAGDSVVLSVTGNPVVGFSCTSNPATTSASGVATFVGCKLTKTGTYTLTATDGAATIASTSLTITPAAAATMQVATCQLNGGSVSTSCAGPFSLGNSGGTLVFTVDVFDAFGNAISTPVTVSAASGNTALYTVTPASASTGGGTPSNRTTAFTVTKLTNPSNSTTITLTAPGVTTLTFTVQK